MSQVADAAKCLVCGDAIQSGNRVECVTCDTPAHRDCFDYNGKCAIFACDGKRYRCVWQPQLPGPRDPDSTVPATRPRTKIRTVHGENEIRIEQTGLLRTLGLGSIGSAAAVAATAPTAGCWADLPSGLGNFAFDSLGELGAILLLIILVPLIFWLLIAVVLPGLMYVSGYVLFLADNSYWTYDGEKERLVLRGRLFGIPYWRRTWRREKIEKVVVGPALASQTYFLAAHFMKDRMLWLADDRRHERIGYSLEDLRRIGKRLAEAMDVPYQEIARQPELPEETSE